MPTLPEVQINYIPHIPIFRNKYTHMKNKYITAASDDDIQGPSSSNSPQLVPGFSEEDDQLLPLGPWQGALSNQNIVLNQRTNADHSNTIQIQAPSNFNISINISNFASTTDELHFIPKPRENAILTIQTSNISSSTPSLNLSEGRQPKPSHATLIEMPQSTEVIGESPSEQPRLAPAASPSSNYSTTQATTNVHQSSSTANSNETTTSNHTAATATFDTISTPVEDFLADTTFDKPQRLNIPGITNENEVARESRQLSPSKVGGWGEPEKQEEEESEPDEALEEELVQRIKASMAKAENQSVFHKPQRDGGPSIAEQHRIEHMAKAQKEDASGHYAVYDAQPEIFTFSDMVFYLAPKVRQMRERVIVEEQVDVDEPTVDRTPCALSLGFLTLEHPLRKICRKIGTSRYFDWSILFFILLNCVFLAIDDDPAPGTPKWELLNKAETIFTIIFTTEMVIKVIAHGFVLHHTCYLRDPWNRLDFIVVVLSYLNYVKGMANYSVIRTFRVIRPLRAIKNVPGMRVIISALLSSLPYLFDVLTLFIFMTLVFGILGVQLFGGNAKQRCMDTTTGKILGTGTYDLCSLAPTSGKQCSNYGPNAICTKTWYNPNYDVTSFDNILVASLTIVQCISLEGWVQVMYAMADTDNKWVQIYFVALIMFGAFFVVNLVTAVIFLRFDQKRREENEKRDFLEALASGEDVDHMTEQLKEAQVVEGANGTMEVILPRGSIAGPRKRLSISVAEHPEVFQKVS